MIDELLDKLTSRLETIEKKYGYLTFLIRSRFTNEKLLHLEIMRIISLMPEVEEYLPEKPYDTRHSTRCDFWFKTSDSLEHWMEIKMRLTNYQKPGHAKAITNAVDSIIQDVKRLKTLTRNSSRRYMLFAFYPLYERNYEKFNKKHLSRISRICGTNLTCPSRRIELGDAAFDIYLVGL